MKTKMNARIAAFVGMLGALSMVLMLVNFPLPFAPTFMKLDFAELPALFAGFFLGPVYGMLVVIVKILLKIVVQGTETAFVGEFSNVVGSSVFVLTAAFIYMKNKTKKGAVLSMAVAIVVVSVLSIFINAYVMFPMYIKLYGMPLEAIIGMGSATNPMVKDMTTLMLFSVFPFNLVKYTLTSTITYLIYKRSAAALKHVLLAAA